MSDVLASLGFEFDTRDIEKAIDKLKELVNASKEAEKATADLGKASTVSGVKAATSNVGGMATAATGAAAALGKVALVVGKIAPVAAIAGLGALAAGINNVAEAAEDMGNMAVGAGVTVEQFSQLAFAAKTAGLSTRDMSRALNDFNQIIAKYKAGEKGAVNIVETLGLAPEEMRDSMTMLEAIADRFAQMPDPVDKANMAIRLFGERMGPRFVQMLGEGSDSMKTLMQRADELGLTFTDKTVKAAREFNTNIEILKGSLAGLGQTIFSDLLPPINTLIAKFIEGKDAGLGFIDAINFASDGFKGYGGLDVQIKFWREKVDSLDKELTKLEESRERYTKDPNSTVARAYAAKVKRLTAELEEAQATLDIRLGQRNKLSGATKPSGSDIPDTSFDLATWNKPKPKPETVKGGGKKKDDEPTYEERRIVALSNLRESLLGVLDPSEKYRRELEDLQDLQRYGFIQNDEYPTYLKMVAELQEKIANLDPATTQLRANEAALADLTGAYKEATDPMKKYIDEYKRLVDLRDQLATTQTPMPQEVFEYFQAQINTRMNEARGNVATNEESAGERAARELAEATAMADEFGIAFTSAFSDAVMSGEDLSGVLKGLLIDLTQIVLIKPALEGLAESFKDIAMSAMTKSAPIEQSMPTIVNALMGMDYMAKGGVFGPMGKVTAFADGGIVSKPTLFKFASGVGLMGEAGAEAIMPLKRGADGKLGVSVSGKGGDKGVNISIGNIGSGVSRADVFNAITSAVRASEAKILDSRKRRGVFA